MYPNSFLVCVRDAGNLNAKPSGPSSYRANGVELVVDRPNPRYMAIHQAEDGFGVYVGDSLHVDPAYVEKKCRTGWNSAADNGSFVRFHAPSGKLSIDSDFLGTEILYYGTGEDGVFISNRIENITPRIDAAPDFLGINQFLLAAHTVRKRTCVKNLYQTRPLKRIEIDTATLAVSEVVSGEWMVNRDLSFDSEAMASMWSDVLDKSPRSVLMLSAGWDSRMLLSNNLDRLVASYSHGDLESREMRLVYALASERLPRLLFNKTNAASYGIETMAEMMQQLGHAFNPHWYFAARECSRFTDAPLTAGIYAEHLSGQYGTTSTGSIKSKAMNLMKGLFAPDKLNALSEEEVRAYALNLLGSSLGTPWFLPDSWREIFGTVDEQNLADIEAALREYQDEGTSGLQEVFERYRLEQTQRQYYARQSRCGIAYNGFHHPYADSRLSKAVVEIPFQHRIQYKMSRAILMHLQPSLLEKPMAATLVKAKAPIFLQESSRGVRIAAQRMYGVITGRRTIRLGWNNFEFLHKTDIFDQYVDALNAEFWDRNKMRKFIKEYREAGKNAYSLLDMFSKILTVDFWVGSRRG